MIAKNVLVTPYTKAWIGGVDHSKAPIYARVLRGKKPIDEFPENLYEEDADKKSGTYLYGGPLKLHFGHVLLDTVPRLHGFDRKIHQGVIFPLLMEKKNSEIPGWVYDIFSYFGLNEKDIHIVRHPTNFESVEFVQPGLVSKLPSPQWYLDYLSQLSYRYYSNTPPNIYLGRTHLINQGTLMGESYFSELLENYVYVKPEEHSLDMQISMLANADRILFTEGSSIYPVSLLPKISGNVYMLGRRVGGSALFNKMVDCRGSFYNLGNENSLIRLDNKNGINKPNSPSYTLDPESVFLDMVHFGMTSKPTFDWEEFISAEMKDTKKYFGSMTERANQQLKDVNMRRNIVLKQKNNTD